MKKLLSVCVILTLLMGLMGALPVSAAGSVSMWVGSTNVTINDSVTVTIVYNGGGEGIGSLDAKFSYNTDTFEYISCTGATAQGGAGVVTISYFSMEETPSKELTISLKFKATKPGAADFKLTTEGLYSDDSDLMVNDVKTIAVTASEPSLSDNANLKSLVPSRGTLTPKFSPDVTDYTISVSNSVESLSLSATTEDADAKTTISGKNALQVGKNTRTITVTAPNGNIKKYTVVINRAAAPTTTTNPSDTTIPTTTAPTLPLEDALEVTVNGKKLTILDTQAPVDLPDGFVWDNLTINRVEVPAAIHRESGMTLLYLTSAEKVDDGFYIYDVEADTFTRYRRLSVAGREYLIFDLPADSSAPAGTTGTTLIYGDTYVSAYTYEDAALADFYIVWAAPLNGEAGWYTYDKKEGTLQRYCATPMDNDVTAPTKKPTKTTARTTGTTAPTKAKVSIGSFFKNNSRIWIYGGIAIGGILVIVFAVILLISLSHRGKGKH